MRRVRLGATHSGLLNFGIFIPTIGLKSRKFANKQTVRTYYRSNWPQGANYPLHYFPRISRTLSTLVVRARTLSGMMWRVGLVVGVVVGLLGVAVWW